MTGAGLVILGTFSVLLCGVVDGATYDNLDSLVTTLFASYKPDLRPFIDNSTPTIVFMGIQLVSLQELDEIDQSLSLSANLYMTWSDHRLRWTSSAYNFTEYFAYPQKYIWIPDITISNTVETFTELGFDRNYLYVSHVGEIEWLPGGVYEISCDIDVTYYPFDTQVCTILFTTMVSRYHEIDLVADPQHSTNLDKYSPSGTWDLISFTTVVENNSDDKSRIGFQIKLKRKPTYYVIAIILPVLFLSLTATLVFALPADSGEKMGTSITVLLAFAVYLTIVSDQMPKTSSSVSILSVYLSVLLGQTALGVMMSVWILNLHFRDDQKKAPGPRTRSLALYMQRLMCKIPSKDRVTPVHPAPSPKDAHVRSATIVSNGIADDSLHIRLKSDVSSPVTPHPGSKPRHLDSHDSLVSASEMMTWKEVAVTFDRFLFHSFSIFLLVASFVFLTILAAGES